MRCSFLLLFIVAALYSMTAAYGGMAGYPASMAAAMAGGATGAGATPAGTLSAATTATASTTASAASQQQQQLAMYQAMYQQLAAQEYLKQLQSAARDPAAYAALASQGVLPNYEMLTGGSKAAGGKVCDY